ncbi:hypothetical protein SPRA44_600135 [Serratia proteamaculans]|nr:hypothetical protein SPRA44_600135 [Serratia proteamaculans]
MIQSTHLDSTLPLYAKIHKPNFMHAINI